MSTEPTLFDKTEPTALSELERVVRLLKNEAETDGYSEAIKDVLTEINRHKPTEIKIIKDAFASGYVLPCSAEDYVKQFKQ